MDANTTVAVDILIRTQMGNASAQFDKELARMEASAKAFANRMNKIFAGINTGVGGGGRTGGRAPAGSSAGADPAMTRALADIGRYQRQREKIEADYTRHVQRQSEQQYRARVNSYRRSAEEFQRTLDQQRRLEGGRGGTVISGGSAFGAVFGGNLAAQAVVATTQALKAGAQEWFRYSSSLEQAQIGMETMTGSATVAAQHIRDLQQFAAKTPFEFEELVDASRKLQAVGFEANKVIPILNSVGNSLAAAGRIGDLPFAIKALTDIQAKGKLAGQEIIQLANAGIPIREVLAKELGKTQAEIVQLGEKGAISADLVFAALHRMSNERFGDAMAKQSRTAQGALTNIIDSLKITSNVAFKPLFDRFSTVAVELADRVQAQGNDFTAVGTLVGEYIMKGLGAAIGAGLQALAGYMGRRLREIFTEGKIIDPITSGLVRGTIDGLLSGVTGIEDNRVQREKTLVRLNVGAEIAKAQMENRAINVDNVLSKNLSMEDNIAAINEFTAQMQKIAETGKSLPDIGQELKIKEAAAQAKALLDTTRQLKLSAVEGDFRIAAAGIAGRTAFTPAQREANARAQQGAEREYLNAQIRIQRQHFRERLDLVKDNATEYKKTEQERDQTLQQLRNELVVSELNAQKEITDIHREELEKRRAAQIRAIDLQIEATEQGFDRLQSEIERGLAKGTVTYAQSYERQLDASQELYDRLVNLNQRQLEATLQDERLSGEERINLRQEYYLRQQQLAEDNANRIFQIEQKRLEDHKRQISQELDFTVQGLRSRASIISSALGLIFGDASTSGRSRTLFNTLSGAPDTQIAAAQSRIGQLQRQRLGILDVVQGIPKMQTPAGTINMGITRVAQGIGDRTFTARPEDVQAMTDAQLSTFRGLEIQERELFAHVDALEKVKAELAPLYQELEATMKSFKPTAEGVDEFMAVSLGKDQAADRSAIAAQISAQERIIALTKDERQLVIENQKLDQLKNDQRAMGIDQLREQEELYRKSIAGLTEYNAALAAGDEQATAFAQNKAVKERLTEEAALRERIIGLNDRLVNGGGVVDALEIQTAALEDILDLRNRERDAIIESNRAQLEMVNQTVYSATQANAQVLTFLASQKGVTEAMADFRIGLIESGYDLIDRALDSILPKMGRFTSTIRELIASFVRLWLQPAFRFLFGGGSPGGGGGAGGAAGAASGGGSILQRLLGGGGGGGGSAAAAQAGAFGTPPFNPNAGFNIPGLNMGSTSSGTTPAAGGAPFEIDTSGIFGTDVTFGGTSNNPGDPPRAAAAAGGRGLSAAWQNQIAGALAGGLLGSQLGQGSTAGSILGGVGGAIGGTLLTGLITSGSVAGATTGGIFGSTAGLFGLSGAATFGIGLAIAGGLMLVSWLFGRAARRRREQREVNRISGDALSKIQQLLADVQNFRIDGATAYSQGTQIRDEYAQEITKLKTKPAKALARQKLAEINNLLNSLKTEGDRADRLRSIAQTTDERLIPTFHSGGFTGSGYGVMGAMVKSHEAILTQSNIMAMGGYRRLADAGVAGMPMGAGYERSYNKAAPQAAAKAQDVYVVGVFDESTADEMFDKVSTLGVAKKVKFAAKSDLGGMVREIEKKLING